jgi:ABC-2 type transport system permease protein
MRITKRRVWAITRKELREYRRSGNVIAAMAILPLVFIITPLAQAFALPASTAHTLYKEFPLIYLLAIPALVPATLAAFAVVGERQQGTLEPVLSTPIRREELILGKALAAFIPSLIISYAVYGFYLAVVELFVQPTIAHALIRGGEVLVQVLFTPPLAAWSIWLGIGVSARSNDVRTAQQLAALGSLPCVAVSSLIAYNVIHPTVRLAGILLIALLALDRIGWRVVSAAFDRERLITSTK